MMRTIYIAMFVGAFSLPLGAAAVDADGDGYDSVATGGTDCNDIDPDVNEAADESCNGRDDDCDGSVDEDFDEDGDGFTSCNGDCDDSDAGRNPGAAEACDGVDNDCDEEVDEGLDGDGDGYLTCGEPADCNDSDPAVSPDGTEECNGRDDNCDGVVDEELDCPVAESPDVTEAGSRTVGGGCACDAASPSSSAPAAGLLAALGALLLRRR